MLVHSFSKCDNFLSIHTTKFFNVSLYISPENQYERWKIFQIQFVQKTLKVRMKECELLFIDLFIYFNFQFFTFKSNQIFIRFNLSQLQYRHSYNTAIILYYLYNGLLEVLQKTISQLKYLLHSHERMVSSFWRDSSCLIPNLMNIVNFRAIRTLVHLIEPQWKYFYKRKIHLDFKRRLK